MNLKQVVQSGLLYTPSGSGGQVKVTNEAWQLVKEKDGLPIALTLVAVLGDVQVSARTQQITVNDKPVNVGRTGAGSVQARYDCKVKLGEVETKTRLHANVVKALLQAPENTVQSSFIHSRDGEPNKWIAVSTAFPALNEADVEELENALSEFQTLNVE